eukprot:3077226-Alexandrium_andersonii.AAC.1
MTAHAQPRLRLEGLRVVTLVDEQHLGRHDAVRRHHIVLRHAADCLVLEVDRDRLDVGVRARRLLLVRQVPVAEGRPASRWHLLQAGGCL